MELKKPSKSLVRQSTSGRVRALDVPVVLRKRDESDASMTLAVRRWMAAAKKEKAS